MTPTTGYRFKIPSIPDPLFPRALSRSFGIEPCGLNSEGKTVKTGKALLRIVIWLGIPNSQVVAHEAAKAITDHINKGGTYAGPKTVNIDAAFSIETLQGWLK